MITRYDVATRHYFAEHINNKEWKMILSDKAKKVQEAAIEVAKKELESRASDVDRQPSFPRDGLQKLAEA